MGIPFLAIYNNPLSGEHFCLGSTPVLHPVRPAAIMLYYPAKGGYTNCGSKKIGSFLKTLRTEQHLTQELLAEKLGVSNRTVSRWENGVNMPDFDFIIEMANMYNVSIEEILNGERSTIMIDKKQEKSLLKVADYESVEKTKFIKRINYIFIAALIAFIIYAAIECTGLTKAGDVYEDIASFALGLVFGALITGVIFTGRYAHKIKAFKMRLLLRDKENV